MGLHAILDLLDQERDPTARADLATELVGISARYEDAMDRAVYPALRKISQDLPELDRAESDQLAIREALTDLRHRTQNVKPSNVYVSDPEGFEELLDRLVDSIRMHLDHEDKMLFPWLEQLSELQVDELRDDVEQAVAHASTHPHPPHSTVGRAVTSVMEKLNRSVHDQSTVSHPEIDRFHDDLEASAEPE
jgi:Hemerythrin HHE cation binding domain